MPDVVWTLLADPANRPVLALTLAGLIVIVFGPWAIVKLAQRRGGAQRRRRGGIGGTFLPLARRPRPSRPLRGASG